MLENLLYHLEIKARSHDKAMEAPFYLLHMLLFIYFMGYHWDGHLCFCLLPSSLVCIFLNHLICLGLLTLSSLLSLSLFIFCYYEFNFSFMLTEKLNFSPFPCIDPLMSFTKCSLQMVYVTIS